MPCLLIFTSTSREKLRLNQNVDLSMVVNRTTDDADTSTLHVAVVWNTSYAAAMHTSPTFWRCWQKVWNCPQNDSAQLGFFSYQCCRYFIPTDFADASLICTRRLYRLHRHKHQSNLAHVNQEQHGCTRAKDNVIETLPLMCSNKAISCSSVIVVHPSV